MKFIEACAKAQHESLRDSCTVYVSIRCNVDSAGCITDYHFVTDNWYDPSVVRTYLNGELHEHY